MKEKKKYEYRIIAENEGGVSAPSTESIPTKAKLLKGIATASGGRFFLDRSIVFQVERRSFHTQTIRRTGT